VSEFIFMLTHNDATVPDAIAVWRQLAETDVRYVGFKDVGIKPEARRALIEAIHESGRPVMLEVVSESLDAELRCAEAAASLGVEYLLGGVHVAEVVPLLDGTAVRYLPFVGRPGGHPVRLQGTVEEIVASARSLAGVPAVAGVDLLAYRHEADPEAVAAGVIDAIDLPVVIAGSVDSEQRVRRICELGAWAFTVGSALFDGGFGPPGATLAERASALLDFTDALSGVRVDG